MIMIFMCRVEKNIEIAGAQPRFHDVRDFNRIPLERKTCKRIQQNLSVGAKIEQSGNCHITADPGSALQI